LALLITGLLVLKPSPDAPDKDLYTGNGLGSHRSPKAYYHNIPFNQIIFLQKEQLPYWRRSFLFLNPLNKMEEAK
jgi:hypothetical protein